MKLSNLIPIFFLLIITFSCNKENNKPDEVYLEKFPEVIRLEGYPLVLQGIHCIADIGIIDSVMLIIDACSEHYLHFFNLKDYERINSYTRKGKGPGEFSSMPEFFGQTKVTEDGTSFYLTVNNYSTVAEYSLNDIIKSNTCIAKEKFSLFITNGIVQSVVFLNDHLVAGSSNSKEGRIFTHNYLTDNTVWKHRRNNDKNYNIHPSNINRYDYGILLGSPLRDKIVEIQFYTSTLNIYDNELNLLKTITNAKNTRKPDFSKPDIIDAEITFSSVIAKEDYIYVLEYCPPLNRENADQRSSNILVLNWEGEPIKKYTTEESLYTFAVDETNNKIFGISDDEEFLFVYYIN